MTGQRGPRHAVATPAATTSSAPSSTATRHGVPVMMACPVDPTIVSRPVPLAPEPEPVIVDPTAPEDSADPGEPTWLAATLSTEAAVTAVPAATAAPIPNAASSAPATLRSTPRVAITAARQ